VDSVGNPLVVGADNAIYALRDNAWDRLTGEQFSDVAGGANGEIYGTSKDDLINGGGKIKQWNEETRSWEHITGAAIHVSATPDGPVVVNSFHQVWFGF